MNSDVLQALERLTKASKHAHRLRSSLDKLLYLLPDAHDAWRKMAKEARHTEVYLQTMLEMIQEMLERDPASYAEIFLLPPDTRASTLSPSEQNDIQPCAFTPPTET